LSHQALYRKWRPLSFDDVVGQQHITSALKAQTAAGRLSHAYLFTGTRGTGKTTCAKILARAVNCENPRDGNPCNACPACVGIDNGSLLDANTAAILGKALEPYRIMYYEEPTMPCNHDVYKHIKSRCSLPLATGERSYTRWGFRQFFEDRTLDIIQPDLCNTGGITETKKICDMAKVYDIGVQIHVCGGPIATAAALQVEAAIPNFTIHEEHNANLLKVFKDSGTQYYAPVNGFYDIPELPGIGQEMSQWAMDNARKVVIE